MYEFYMEQSSIGFGYISKHSPQVSGLNLCSCYKKHNCIRLSCDPSSSRRTSKRGGGRWEQQGRYVISNGKHPLFCSPVNWCSTTKHSFTSCLFPWHSGKIRVDNVLLSFLNPLNAELNPICHLLALLRAHPILHISRIRVNNALPIIQCHAGIVWLQGRSWFAKMPCDTNVRCSIKIKHVSTTRYILSPRHQIRLHVSATL